MSLKGIVLRYLQLHSLSVTAGLPTALTEMYGTIISLVPVLVMTIAVVVLLSTVSCSSTPSLSYAIVIAPSLLAAPAVML